MLKVSPDEISVSVKPSTTERQKAANRANARHSTGPKTAKGKAAVRLNACRHGLFARDIVLPEEDADAFEDLWNRVRADLSPAGPIERFLVDRVAEIMWRLGRLKRAETALFYSRAHGLKAKRLQIEVRSYESDGLYLGFLQPLITDDSAHTQASEGLKRANYEQSRDEVLVGLVIDADAKEGDAFAKLARYERTLERSLFQTLEELRRIQDRRRNRPSSPILDATTDTEGTE
jgi:hypothetical protein